jgi:hypothetical protein
VMRRAISRCTGQFRTPPRAHVQCNAILCTLVAKKLLCHIKLCRPSADPANRARLQVPAQVHQPR